MPILIIKGPLGETVEIPLTKSRYSIGRSADNDVVLEGPEVSRYHAVLRKDQDTYFIKDLGSQNGIYINRREVRQESLKDNDLIRIGNHELRYGELSAIEIASPSETHTVEKDYDTLVRQLSSTSIATPTPAEASIRASQIHRERLTLGLLFDLSQSMSGLYSIEEVSLKALDVLLQATRADRVAIFLLEEASDRARPFLVSQRDPRAERSDGVSISSTVVKRVLHDRKAIVSFHAAEDPRFASAQSVMQRGLRSFACAPLVGKGGNLGILYMENNRLVGAFTNEDLELLCAVAAQLGLSVENARFFEALRQMNEELERKVEERTAQLRESELKLYRAEKIASLSRLVAGVAHEINNPLGALKSNLELVHDLARRAPEPAASKEAVGCPVEMLQQLTQDSVAACARIVNVVRALRTFARLDESEFKPADLNEGLRISVQLLEPTLLDRIEVKLNLGNIPQIPCYPALLNEAFMNLLNNACQAIPDTGQVVIESRQEGRQVVISIQDTGAGIPPEHLANIFDPGFTTKGVRVGIGMGLAIAYSVIKEHQGDIQVASQPGQGATFTIRLPIGQL